MKKFKFPKNNIGKHISMDDNESFIVFRHLSAINLQKQSSVNPPRIFIVRFKFRNFSFRINKLLSCLPIPLIWKTKGFRQKIWVYQKSSGFWQGMYEFDNPKDVQNYQKSAVFKKMCRRAASQSIQYYFASGQLQDYIDNRLQ